MDTQDPMEPDPDPDSRSTSAPQKKSKTWLVFLVALTSLSCVLVICFSGIALFISYQYQDTIQTSLPFTYQEDKPLQNQIAFVGNDGNIWLVSPNGKNRRPVTTDGHGYSFPAWSPDGKHLAFLGGNTSRSTRLYISPSTTPNPSVLYHSPNSAPFYFYWSPNSQALTFLTQEDSGLALRMVKTESPDEAHLLGRGEPFYWVWSPSGDKLLMHVGGSRAFSQDAHLSVLNDPETPEQVQLKINPGQFQAPLWSADGRHIFYVTIDDTGKQFIYKGDQETLTQERLTDLSRTGRTYLAISPDGRYIAYLEAHNDQAIPLGKAYLIDVNGREQKTLTERMIISFYWSPDGTKLALLSFNIQEEVPSTKIEGLASPLRQDFRFQWWIYNVDTGQIEALTSFLPTSDFLQLVPYFDQYHLSLTLWSPDSRYLLVTSRSLSTDNGTVSIVDTLKQEAPQVVGEGTLAVWSWQ